VAAGRLRVGRSSVWGNCSRHLSNRKAGDAASSAATSSIDKCWGSANSNLAVFQRRQFRMRWIQIAVSRWWLISERVVI
jgi:hypothetical protein